MCIFIHSASIFTPSHWEFLQAEDAADRMLCAARRVLAQRPAALARLLPARPAAATAFAATFAASAAAHTSAAQPGDVPNPLLTSSLFPRFADVRAEHVGPAMESRLAEAEIAMTALEQLIETKLAKGDTPTYSELADEAERIGESVSAPWSTASHLKAVKDTPALRKAIETMQPRVVAFSTRCAQSSALYRGWLALRADEAAWAGLTAAQRRVAELEILGAKLSGIGLEGAQKERFNEITKELGARGQARPTRTRARRLRKHARGA